MTFDVTFRSNIGSFNLGFLASDPTFSMDFGVTTGIASETYKGEYEVVPDKSNVFLYTKNKLMEDDVTVLSVPIYEVQNPSGGQTITIGG